MAIETSYVESTRASLARARVGVVPADMQSEVAKLLGKPEVAVSIDEIDAFLRSQSARLQAVTDKIEIKASSAEISSPPPQLFAEPEQPPVSAAERAALEGLVTSQSGIEDLQGIIDQLGAKYGDPSADFGQSLFDNAMLGQIRQESDKKEKEWREFIARLLRNPNADASSVFVAIGEAMSDIIGDALRDAFKQYRLSKEEHHKAMASFDLEGGGAGEILQAQVEQSNYATDSQQWAQVIQMLIQDLHKFQNLSKSLTEAEHRNLSDIIRLLSQT